MKKIFTIFGNPVSHSRSPLMHNVVFKHLAYNATYTRTLLLDGERLKETFLALGLSGANITVPHKEAAYKACDEVRGFAKKIGVVNTIVNENGKLVGYNTDADGFLYAIREFKNIKKILIIGAGGTAKALASKLLEEQFSISVLNRSASRLEYFYKLSCKVFTWETFELSQYDLVINTTSAGLKDEELPAPVETIHSILSHTKYVADVIYGKMTPFLKMTKEKNIPYKDGTDMLLGQGILANELFVHKTLDKKSIQKWMSYSFEL